MRHNLDLDVISSSLPNAHDLTRIRTVANTLPEGGDKIAAVTIYAIIRLLWDARQLLLLEGSAAFEEYASAIASSKRKSNMTLASDAGFKRIREIAASRPQDHPKVQKLLELAEIVKNRQYNCGIFTESEAMALFLTQLLAKHGFTAEVILAPGADHAAAATPEHASQTLERFQKSELQFVIAPSIIQKLILKANANRYIQYSCPDHYQAKRVLTERQENGWVKKIYHLVLQHELEMVAYWEAYYQTQFPARPKKTQTAELPMPALSMTLPKKVQKPKGRGKSDPGQYRLFK